MPDTYTVGEAARLLGISVETLRRWDKDGRIRTERDKANRRTVPASEVSRLRGETPHGISARNHFAGVVQSVKVEVLLGQVEMASPIPPVSSMPPP